MAQMSGALRDQLSAFGSAQILVALQPDANAGVSGDATPGFVSLLADARPTVALAESGRSRRRAKGAPHFFPRLGVALGFSDEAGIRAIEGNNGVASIDLAPVFSLIRPVETAAASAPKEIDWNMNALNLPAIWSRGLTGTDVRIGQIDTGVDASHQVLAGGIAGFLQTAPDGNRVRGAVATDSGTHGTHTAGTILGRAASGRAIGVAPDAKLFSAMVIEGGNVVARILQGLEWLIEQRVRVANISLGLRGFTPAFQPIVEALRANGILPVVAVGNEGPGTSRSPGNYANVLSVGYCDRNFKVAGFSSSEQFQRPANGLVPTIVAPGVDIVSCVPGGGYARMSGSSMATPHIAGLAAILLQAVPNASVAQLESAIVQSATLRSGMDAGRANRGLPDAVEALRLLSSMAGAAMPPMLATTARTAAPRSKKAAPQRAKARK